MASSAGRAVIRRSLLHRSVASSLSSTPRSIFSTTTATTTCFSCLAFDTTSSSSSSKAPTARLALTPGGSIQQYRWNTLDTKNAEIVYESQFSHLVFRLKAVSLTTCGIGLFGMPALIALYSGDLPYVTKLLMGAAAVVSGGASTVALAFVFDPYVHSIEKIPVRVCHAKIELTKNNDLVKNDSLFAKEPAPESAASIEQDDSAMATNNVQIETPPPREAKMAPTTRTASAEKLTGELIKNASEAPPKLTGSNQPEAPYLLKAVTRNILLMKVETVFNPTTDITPYGGIRPIANFAAKDKAFYVHHEFIFDETLRSQLHFLIDKRPTKAPPPPDDDDLF